MRIGFFTDTFTPQINGVVTSIRLFAKALERQGHVVYIFAPTPRQPSDGPRIVRIPSVPFAFQPEMRLAAAYSNQAYRLVRRANLDIVHAHDPFAVGLFGFAVSQRFRIPYVHTHHAVYEEYVHYVWESQVTRSMATLLTKEFSDQCDTVLAPSTKIRQMLLDSGVTTPVVTLPTGVDARRFAPRDSDARDVAAFRKRHGIPNGARLLTFVGRLGIEKSIDLLIDAMTLLRTPDAHLLVVGNGPHREKLLDHIGQAGIEDRVTFTGYLQAEDTRIAYHASEALFFGSTSETQGLVIAEAMASGLPVVAVDDLAIADAVADGINGLLVEAVPEAMAAAADSVLGDRELRQSMSRASVERAWDISIDRQAERLAEIYSRLVVTKPAPRRVGDRRRAVRRRVTRELVRLRAIRREGGRIVRRFM